MADYQTQCNGSFKSAMQWSDLDDLWRILRTDAEGWYVYAVGEPVPDAPLSTDQFNHFIDQMDALLRTEHTEAYCGIVYADDLIEPQMVKIYDPNNLGVSCGYSDSPPLPGWVISRTAPIDLPATQVLPKSRQRWWRKLFAG